MDLNQMKVVIKNWEDGFCQINNRKPSGKDILSAPKDVFDIYKKYKKQKSNIQTNVIHDLNSNKKIISKNVALNRNDISKESEVVLTRINRDDKNNNEKENDPWKVKFTKKSDAIPASEIVDFSMRSMKKSIMSMRNESKNNSKMIIERKDNCMDSKEHITDVISDNKSVDTFCYLNEDKILNFQTKSSLYSNKKNSGSSFLSKARELNEPVNEIYKRKRTEILYNDVIQDNSLNTISNKDTVPNVLESKNCNENKNNESTHISLTATTNIFSIPRENISSVDYSKESSNNVFSFATVEKPTFDGVDYSASTKSTNTVTKAYSPPIKRQKFSTSSSQFESKKRLPTENYVKLNKKFNSYTTKATAKQKFHQKSIRQSKWRSMRCKCYRCGESGHYANTCTKPPTFGPKKESSNINNLGFMNSYTPKISEYNLESSQNFLTSLVPQNYFEISEDPIVEREPIDETFIQDCLKDCLKMFKFKSFRPFQKDIITRICQNKSTLAILPTGSGKSLCYQIPAYLLNQLNGSLAIIVSPLISLMQDQLSKLPKKIKGITLNSTLSYEAKKKLLAEIAEGGYSFLLLSPEAIVDSTLLSADKLPPISFVCVDEVHCLWDWSHHFRPSYFRVCKVLREKFKVKCFLGLSATCTVSSMLKISEFLAIDPQINPDSIVRLCPIRDNLNITVSEAKGSKETHLLKLLKKPPFCELQSILVYCSTREDTVDVARNIRLGMGSMWTAETYHAGLPLKERARLQKRFMRGEVRVLVATVAFGMGLDKPDVGAVVHYTRPQTFAGFVQEIGRAGRNGMAAHAHVMLSASADGSGVDGESQSVVSEGRVRLQREETNALHKHVFQNHVEPCEVRKFLSMVFSRRGECSGGCRGHVNSIVPMETAMELNVSVPTLETLLCYLELMPCGERPVLRMLPASYQSGRLSCYRGAEQMAEMSRRSELLAWLLTLQPLETLCQLTELSVNLVHIWDRTGLEAAHTRRLLKALEWNLLENATYRPTGLGTEFDKWCWPFATRCDLSEDELGVIQSYILEKLLQLENQSIAEVNRLHAVFLSNRSRLPEISDNSTTVVTRSSEMKRQMMDHFEAATVPAAAMLSDVTYSSSEECESRDRIRAFIMQHRELQLSAKSIVCVMHGINSAHCPKEYWQMQKRFWRSLLSVDFRTLKLWAQQELRALI